MSLLEQLRRDGHLRTLDHAFAHSLRRLDPDTPDAVLVAVALAAHAVSAGHAGVDLAAPQLLVDAAVDWPDAETWQQQLAASRWVAQPSRSEDEARADAPLVLEHGLLYLRRYREYERALVLGLQRIAAATPANEDLAPLAALFAQLFPRTAPAPAATMEAPTQLSLLAPAEAQATRTPAAPEGDDRQARAAALALRHSLLLVTGGPGTGKTTTITRLLVLLAAQAAAAGRTPPRIALAAPTGRAAERMAESVRHALAALTANGVDPALCAQLPVTGSTLHRLLGTIPDAPRFRHHADNPLPFDVVVVDEASMIDLPLMAKLVDAVPDGARLVLIGDPDQLPSVEAGDVLSAVLRAAGDGHGLPADDAAALAPLLGTSPVAAPVSSNFPGRRVHLLRGWRQSDALQLAPLADAVRTGDADTALALLQAGTLSNVHFDASGGDPLHGHRDRLLAHWQSLADADSPSAALAQAARLRILTAVREGPQGARTLNARIEALLTGRQAAQPQRKGNAARDAGEAFHGRLLLITENSYRHRLFNGDIGICLRSEASPAGRDDAGHLVAWFPGDTPDAPRAFHPATLPAHDSAFAMTVHKAQGSEFDAVWLLLPARDNRVLSRELVYTGLTRAKSELHLSATPGVLATALARHVSRVSGLAWRLGEHRGTVDAS